MPAFATDRSHVLSITADRFAAFATRDARFSRTELMCVAGRMRSASTLGSDLALLSVDELTQRITLLTEEIARLEAERTRKSASRSAAENLFR